MASPFPGMDPYIENAGEWPDFHASFITYWRDALLELLPDHYEARIDERVQLVGPPEARPWQMLPDVAVIDSGRPPSVQHERSAGIATLEPISVPLPAIYLDSPVERSIRILKRPERTLVTVLELLSPSNKEEPGRSEYIAKRNALLRQNINLFELDLLLRGQRLPMGGPLPPGDLYAVVSRGDGRTNADVYAWSIRRSLPALPVPLKPPDQDVWFDLGEVFATTYERARYGRSLPYHEPLDLPLAEEDRGWAVERVKAKV